MLNVAWIYLSLHRNVIGNFANLKWLIHFLVDCIYKQARSTIIHWIAFGKIFLCRFKNDHFNALLLTLMSYEGWSENVSTTRCWYEGRVKITVRNQIGVKLLLCFINFGETWYFLFSTILYMLVNCKNAKPK